MQKFRVALAFAMLSVASCADVMLTWAIELDNGAVTGNAGAAVSAYYDRAEYDASGLYARIEGQQSAQTSGYQALDRLVAVGSTQDLNLGTASAFDSFIIRLYNANGEIAHSDAFTYADLVANNSDYIYDTMNMKVGGAAFLNSVAGYRAVPEPTGGLLLMMGVAALALRRKRV